LCGYPYLTSTEEWPVDRPAQAAARLAGAGAPGRAAETPLSGALAYSGPNALTYALDVLVPQLAAATGDNPATPVTDLSKAA